MAGPLYPDVPLTPGVPPVLRDTVPPNDDREMTADSPAVKSNTVATWGIFDANGKPATATPPDSFVSFEYAEEHRISDYPVEKGKFESYNKVALPYDARVTFAKSGTDSTRSAFLASLLAILRNTDLYSIVTPVQTYALANLVHVDYAQRSDKGVELLYVELQLREVRSTATIAFTNSKEPSGADVVNDGSVQAVSEDDDPKLSGSQVDVQ